MKVHYFDNHIILAEKKAGLLTQPTDQEPISLETELKEWLKVKMEKQGAVYLHAVHRLDKVASGIVLFAKTSKALERLNAMQKENGFTKIYVAEVEGIIQEDEKVLKHYLSHDEYKAKVSSSPFPDAKLSELKFNILKRKKNTTLVKVHLKTGRYHQIRAQFSFFHHPIVGDEKYGSKTTLQNGILLHHAYLSFIHPVTKEIITCFSAPSFEKTLTVTDLGF